MTTFPLNYYAQFNHVVSLDRQLDELITTINAATAQLHAVTQERAWLTGDTSYRGWEVKPDGTVMKLPNPVCAKNAQVQIKPVKWAGEQVGLLTVDYVLESLKRKDAVSQDPLALEVLS